MDRSTERLIRRDIRARWSPFFILLFLFLGVVVGLGMIGALAYLVRFFGSQ